MEICTTGLLDTPNRVTFIYGLVDPRDNRVRYVGKANDPVARLGGHLRDMRVNHKTCWFKQLSFQGLLPALVILEKTDSEHWEDAERRWIAKFGRGAPVNRTDGGDGISGIDEETRQLFREVQAGKHLTLAHRQAIGKGLVGNRNRRGKSASAETKVKLRAARKGRRSALRSVWSAAARRILSAKRIGKGNPFFGKKHSEKTRALLSLKLRGKPGARMTQQGIERISRATKARWDAGKMVLIRDPKTGRYLKKVPA